MTDITCSEGWEKIILAPFSDHLPELIRDDVWKGWNC